METLVFVLSLTVLLSSHCPTPKSKILLNMHDTALSVRLNLALFNASPTEGSILCQKVNIRSVPKGCFFDESEGGK